MAEQQGRSKNAKGCTATVDPAMFGQMGWSWGVHLDGTDEMAFVAVGIEPTEAAAPEA